MLSFQFESRISLDTIYCVYDMSSNSNKGMASYGEGEEIIMMDAYHAERDNEEANNASRENINEPSNGKERSVNDDNNVGENNQLLPPPSYLISLIRNDPTIG